MPSKSLITASLVLFLITIFVTLQLIAQDLKPYYNPTILVFGDSISSAYGMTNDQGWVSLLNQKLRENNNNHRVINASVSGETTTGGLTRLPKILKAHKPGIVILELGGNDGLRGYPVAQIQRNIQRMIELCKDSDSNVLLVGMVLPYNYGYRYRNAFEKVFVELATNNEVQFLPFLLDGASTSFDLIQDDRIHPRPEAQELILYQIWEHLEGLLK